MGMSEIIEKAAKAMADVMCKRRNGCTTAVWYYSPERAEAISYIKAVLEVMREPSPEMVALGNEYWAEERYAAVIYRAMVNIALEEASAASYLATPNNLVTPATTTKRDED